MSNIDSIEAIATGIEIIREVTTDAERCRGEATLDLNKLEELLDKEFTNACDICEEAYEAGYDAGYGSGYDAGYEDGHEDGYNDALQHMNGGQQ